MMRHPNSYCPMLREWTRIYQVIGGYTMYRFALAISIAFTVPGITTSVFADEPVDGVTVEELRKEIVSLKQTIQELRAKVQELEYGRIPRMSSDTDAAGEKTTTRGPSKLRFPIEIERGTFPTKPILQPIDPMLRGFREK
jgi:hypothetical protein